MAVTDNGDQVGGRTAPLTHGNGSVVTVREDFVVTAARRNLRHDRERGDEVKTRYWQEALAELLEERRPTLKLSARKPLAQLLEEIRAGKHDG